MTPYARTLRLVLTLLVPLSAAGPAAAASTLPPSAFATSPSSSGQGCGCRAT